MFYKALGFAVWKLAMKYLRQRYAHLKKPALALTIAAAIGAIYIATRSEAE